jgi:sucrose-6-phosphate hydrolase SacC (GH32 family)
MSKNNSEPKILLDSDVVRHFINGNQLLMLTRIFPNRFVMPDKVKNELCRSKSIVTQVNNSLTMTKVPVIPFPMDSNSTT